MNATIVMLHTYYMVSYKIEKEVKNDDLHHSIKFCFNTGRKIILKK